MAVPSVAVAVALVVFVVVSSASGFSVRQSGVGSSPTAANSSTCASVCTCSAKDGTVKYLQTVLQQFAREKLPDFSPDPFYGKIIWRMFVWSIYLHFDCPLLL
jgi:hypothetical protein